MTTNNKLLLFIKTPPPTTGATLMNQRVFKSTLLRSYFNVRSICISYMQAREEMGKYKIKKLKIIVRVILNLIYELVYHRPNIVYFQISPTGIAFYRDVIFVTLIKLFRVKILFHLHGKGITNRAKKYNLDNILYKYTFNKSEVICLSKLLVSDIKDVHFGKTYFIPNGIPDSNNLKIDKCNNIKPLNILFLSNLIEQKGILDFILALKIIKSKQISFKASIVGAEADIKSSEINSNIKANELNDLVEYKGPKYGDNKNNIFNEHHILVFPTKLNHETFGIVNVEAMQHGLAVISTNISAIPDIVEDGVTGFLVDTDAPEQIADKLEILLNNPSLCYEMGVKGRKKYEESFTLEKFEKKLTEVLKAAI